MSALYYTLGVLIFVVAILASIALHELGHMIPAKKFGGKVTQYFVGFGSTVWSKKVGETEYGFKSIPLGGYVKIVGMLPPDKDGNLRQSNTGMFTQLIADARAAEAEHVEEGDEDRLFYKMAWWKKVIVMAAGPSVNIAIAFVIFGGLFATYGNIGDPVTEPKVAEVQRCAVPYSESNRECTATDPDTPAYAAGLQEGDEILAFNGTEVDDWATLQGLIRANADGKAVLTVSRDGEEKTLTTHTIVSARPSATDVEDKTLTDVGFLGMLPVVEAGDRRVGLHRRPDGLDDRLDRAGARPDAGQGLGRRQGHRRRAGARPRGPDERGRRRPDRRRDRVRRRTSRSRRRPSSC